MKWNWRVYEDIKDDKLVGFALCKTIYDDDNDIFARGAPIIQAPSMNELFSVANNMATEINKHQDPAPIRLVLSMVDTIDDESSIADEDYEQFNELGQFKLPREVMQEFVDKMREKGRVKEVENPEENVDSKEEVSETDSEESKE